MKLSSGLSLKKILSQNTSEFCQNTSLHGMKYVADNKLKRYERCFFAISVIGATSILICLILRVYEKWENSPVIVGINPKRSKITTEPFPAVTICNLNLALKSKVLQIPKNSTEYTMLRLLCKRRVPKKARNLLKVWNNVENFIVNISQSCQDMLLACRFGGSSFNCSELFQPLITDAGLCCVFNMQHPRYMYTSLNQLPTTIRNFQFSRNYYYRNWSAESGYDKFVYTSVRDKLNPLRIRGVGESLGLSLTLNVQKNQYYCSSSNSVGFRLALHAPNEWTPTVKNLGVFIEPGKETKFHIMPDKTETSVKLKAINPNMRGCLFTNEKLLKFFIHYTQRNCEIEYLANIFNTIMNCSIYFMPRINYTLPICSPYQRYVQAVSDLVKTLHVDDCLPSCNELNFQMEAFSTKLLHGGYFIPNRIIKHLNESYVQDNIAVVHMFFKDNSFRTFKQMEFIGSTDFMSSIGGLMGLFLGFSFLSISELVYFAILRPIRSAIEYFKRVSNLQRNSGNNIHIYQLSTSNKKSVRKLLKNRQNRFLKRSKIFNQNIYTIPEPNSMAIETKLVKCRM